MTEHEVIKFMGRFPDKIFYRCKNCLGSGDVFYNGKHYECPVCQGKGKIPMTVITKKEGADGE